MKCLALEKLDLHEMDWETATTRGPWKPGSSMRRSWGTPWRRDIFSPRVSGPSKLNAACLANDTAGNVCTPTCIVTQVGVRLQVHTRTVALLHSCHSKVPSLERLVSSCFSFCLSMTSLLPKAGRTFDLVASALQSIWPRLAAAPTVGRRHSSLQELIFRSNGRWDIASSSTTVSRATPLAAVSTTCFS